MEETLDKVQPIDIVVDYRETKLLEALSSLSDCVIRTSNLEVGDVIIKSNIADHPFTLIFERKTGPDLAASIKDGRYSEQKARILSVQGVMPHQCTYILEGGLSYASVSKSSIDGAIIHTMFRDQMHVMTTRDVHETATFIQSVALKAAANPKYFVATSSYSPEEYVCTLKAKTKKIDNIDKATCYIMQLCQIPGISHKIAKELATVYPSMTALLTAIGFGTDVATNKEKGVELLCKINMIAKKKATVIIDYLL